MSRLALALSVCVTLSALLAGCSGGSAPVATAAAEEKKAEDSQPVETARVEQGELTARYAATATLQAEQEAQIVAEVPGTVMQLLVEEGDQVQKGQLLARIDAAHSQLQLREAEADLQRRKNEMERGEKLLARKLIAETSHDQAESEFAVRRAEVALARVVVAKSEIRAPFDGIVTRRWIKRGQLLAANAPVFDIADFRDLRADSRVPERDAVALAAGQPVTFTVDAFDDRRYDASIERVAPVVDRDSGTVKVTVRIDNRDRSLRPGLFTRMDIAYLHVANALLMPKTAVLGSRGEEFAYVIENGKAHRAAIRTGHENGSRVQVLEGIGIGAEVVVTGQAALNEGTLVQVLNPEDNAKLATAALVAAGNRGS